jgi:nucleotide-binding universal stress UspA family protein
MTILHPTDFSECAEQARGQAIRLARAFGAEVVLLHVAMEAPLYGEGLLARSEVRKVFDAQREWASRALEERAAEMRGGGTPTLARVVVGAPHQAIVEVAKEIGAELIVMGTHGRGTIERFFLGSVADRVVRSAPCAVVTVREAPAKGD